MYCTKNKIKLKIKIKLLKNYRHHFDSVKNGENEKIRKIVPLKQKY